MKIEETHLKGCYIIEPKIFEDKRGYFLECYNQQRFQEATGLLVNFVQDNQSKSGYGVLRGLHYQRAPYAQAKLVSVLEGKVLDICVDLRKGSPTYGLHLSVELDSTSKKQLYIPKGFAHGFVVLSETAVFQYKCDDFYAPQYEGGIAYNDPALHIDWKVPATDLVISEKDLHLRPLSETEINFAYQEG